MASYLTKKRYLGTMAALAVVLGVSIVLALSMGSESIELFSDDPRSRLILFTARLPRTILAALVGMALASSGGAFQAILKNPLADPFILGISGGAALGSVLAVGLGLPFFYISTLAFAGSIVAIFSIFFVVGFRGKFRAAELLLTGVVFNAFCFAMILFINAVVTMEEAYQILFLLIGNIEETGLETLAAVAVFVIAGFVALVFMSRRMNALLIGDDEARALGIDTTKLRAAVFFAASLMVGAAVAASGLIGFVGLFVPHAIRLVFGSDQRLLIPASGLAGASFLVLADAGARTVLMNTGYATELPVGVITAIIGAPLFMVLLKRGMSRKYD